MHYASASVSVPQLKMYGTLIRVQVFRGSKPVVLIIAVTAERDFEEVQIVA
jgi:hypothetical protein